MKISKNQIALREFLHSDAVLIRDVMSLIRDATPEIDPQAEFVLDLAGIRMISRAFAHGLLVYVEEMAAAGRKLQLLNTAPDVQKMLATVSSGFRDNSRFRPDLEPAEATLEDVAGSF